MPSVSTVRRISLLLILTLVALNCSTNKVRAFNERDVLMLNVALPAAFAAIRAYHNGEDPEKAALQAAFGGYLMHQGFKMAPKMQEQSAAKAWQAKCMVNLGASIAESAGKEFVFRMDIGPVWLIAKNGDVKIRPGLNSVIAPAIHLLEGSTLDFERSLRYGTMAFKRSSDKDGTLDGSSALAYSNANTFTTNGTGAHAGHELVHTFQYRRDAMYPLRVGNFIKGFDEYLGDRWVDDTAWSINWGLQCAWADATGRSKDFDIPMEKEAYYLEKRYREPWR
ncbi:MAG: hypothetical protein GQF41_4366 [Candidatus Rifleibacterium amylolyticum]|nr:MAG: hypothetical protein GQF41_4366 [Candidatus Rifleibacterium amylolyticum]